MSLNKFMVEIIPAILVKDFEELTEKLSKVKPYVNWVQIDISDGNFTPNVTWNDTKQLKNFDARVLLEAHLMISKPEKYIDQWIESGAKRIIVHIEALKKDVIKEISEKCHRAGLEFGVALNPKTPVDTLDTVLDKVDLVLFLAVHPGFGGQNFLEEVLFKIKNFRQKNPNVKIEVDGGVNLKTGKKCVEAGANILVSGSYIFKSKNIAKTIEKLKSL